jgi:putative addiction module component (TIGR02574 family)
MSKAAEDLLKKALSLDLQDRASLAGALIESLEGDVDPDAEGAWEAEIRRRVSELESHSVETVPWSTVKERLFNGFE